MTGDEILDIVRANYGDTDNNFLTTAALQDWLNLAVQEVYSLIPAGEMRQVTQEAAVALTSGRGDIPSTWDKILSVYEAEGELVQVPSHVANAQQNLSSFFVPDVHVYAIDGNEIMVVPTSVASVTVQYTVEPAEITNFTAEISGLPTRFHPALADLVTSYAYASEEDLEQSGAYRGNALTFISRRAGVGS